MPNCTAMLLSRLWKCSAIAASILRSRGVEQVINLVGGYGDWRKANLPTTTDNL